ncbi:MAG: hypothetical protein HZA52_08160 [Planctomycetes bacterium]|nr:hypothetical protein [Planctomycetota bacterium]
MTAAITFTPCAGKMNGELTNLACFPGEYVRLNVPEFIGDAAQPCTPLDMGATWSSLGQGAWRSTGQTVGELSYQLDVLPAFDYVDLEASVTNESVRHWTHSFAFNCCNCGPATPLRDHEGMRFWGRANGSFRRLVTMHRRFNPRPTVQVYSAVGAPAADEFGFMAKFLATSNVVLEGWLALRSRDGTCLAATVSKPAGFLFHNLEFSCVHSAPSFGPLAPGQTCHARTRLYFVQASLEAWHARMTGEF